MGSGLTIETNPHQSERKANVNTDSLTFSFDLGAWINDNLPDELGLEFNFPQVSASIKSGYEIRQDENDTSIPVRDNQPYIFATFNTNVGVTWGEIEIGVKSTDKNKLPFHEITVILDPTDPFLYLQGNEGSGAISVNGRAQFHPNVELEDFSEEEDVIYGHVFFNPEAGITLPYGLSLTGNALVDLDANDDGAVLGGVFVNRADWLSADTFLDALSDVSIGVNGDLYFGPKFNKGFFKHFDVSVRVGKGTILFDGDQDEIHFGGQTVNPFAGTPLEELTFLQNELNISGSSATGCK